MASKPLPTNPVPMAAPTLTLVLALLLLRAGPACAWGDEGHAVIARIALHYLTPAVQQRVQALLASDHSGLVADTGLASEASWADRYRDADRDTTGLHYLQTRQWHYVDIERDAPDLNAACFGAPALPPGVVASEGPPMACVVDKIEQFERELRAPGTAPQERLRALQFVLHLVGDVHQPLHAIDDHDAGGNARRVGARGLRAGSLHFYWDVEFVRLAGPDPGILASQLQQQISAADLARWRRGTPADWAREAFGVALAQGYGALPARRGRRIERLSRTYVEDATQAVTVQLKRAGVRLALVLDRSLQ
jgi:hypothetical protein